MPHFKWRGVNLQGKIKRGVMFAGTEAELDAALFQQDIALLNNKRARMWGFSPITIAIQIQFFRQLSELLQVGVALVDALTIVSQQLDNPRFQEITHVLKEQVQQGIHLHDAMMKYPRIFKPMTVQMVSAGHESGKLALVLLEVAQYLEMQNVFVKQVRSALLMPIITLGSFFVVAGVMLATVVPQFASLFSSLDKELPKLTRLLIQVSSYVDAWHVGLLVLSFAAFVLCIKWYTTIRSGKRIYDWLLLQLPGVRYVVQYRAVVHITRALSMLLASGVRIVPALNIAQNVSGNIFYKDMLKKITRDVTGGSTFGLAIRAHAEQLFGQDVIAAVTVGQESGALAKVLSSISETYQEKLRRSLTLYISVLQPLLLLILAVLIALLIFALYLPVLGLSSAI